SERSADGAQSRNRRLFVEGPVTGMSAIHDSAGAPLGMTGPARVR
ncbi:MAG: hypothetical protein K0S86_5452, partial [Geminicoccaceae bacterium]|nr:hypothetical protein [Geminicoccaceae bacterium]